MTNSIAGTPSIVGEQFPDFVVDQINQRQKIHGSINRDNSQLSYLNSKTAWCSLVSSINITNIDRFKGTPLENITSEIGENKLASKLILSGGVSRVRVIATYDLPDLEIPLVGLATNQGISNTDSKLNNNAYGFGGLEFGQVPMPGIISANFRSENRGSLRTGEIQIKAFNRTQFEMIDALFLRLGYTILFEFGWSSYYNNKGDYSLSNNSVIGSFLYPNEIKLDGENLPYVDQDVILQLINFEKENSNGNYDAMLAKVKNFSWSFNKDGSYDITLSVVSIGDIIESLQVNVIDPKVLKLTTQKERKENKKTNQELLDDDSTDLSKIFESYKESSVLVSVLYVLCYDMFNLNKSSSTYDTIKIKINKDDMAITFSSLLEIIKNYIIISSENGTNGIQIQNDYEKTFIYNHPDQVSCDPRICMVNKKIKIKTSTTYTAPNGVATVAVQPNIRGLVNEVVFGETTLQTNSDIVSFDTISIPFATIEESKSDKIKVFNSGNSDGDLMAVYLNFRFILKTLESAKNEDGVVTLLDFLTKICDGINNALGNINKISPVYDHDTNTISFVDETPLERNWKIEPAKAKFELYGYNLTNNTAGFIQDFTLKTELTPAMATAISVGAQANASPVGESQTSFTKWNVGLEDRIWKEKKSSTQEEKLTPEEQSKADEITKQNIKDLIDSYEQFLSKTYSSNGEEYNESDFESYPSIMNSMIKYHNTLWASSTNSSGSSPTDVIGFIPINLSLTMDGLSGMKIYQRFNVDTKFLPSKYTDTLEFIVKGISHEIANNKWVTKIETFMVPKVVTAPTNSLFIQITAMPEFQQILDASPFNIQAIAVVASQLLYTIDFLIDILKGLGISSPNQSQINFMKAWRQHEGGKATYNPFNTTQKAPGATDYNNVGVKNYVNREQGLKATIDTLNNGLYKNIIFAIKNIKVDKDINNAMFAVNNSPWGSKFNPVDYTKWTILNNYIYIKP